MKKIIKVSLWFLGISILILVVFFATLLYFKEPFEEWMSEIQTYAETSTGKEGKECFVELSRRLENCNDLGCLAIAAGFGSACIGSAKGNREEFCINDPKTNNEYAKGNWLQKYCIAHNLSKDGCVVVFETIVEYCFRKE